MLNAFSRSALSLALIPVGICHGSKAAKQFRMQLNDEDITFLEDNQSQKSSTISRSSGSNNSGSLRSRSRSRSSSQGSAASGLGAYNREMFRSECDIFVKDEELNDFALPFAKFAVGARLKNKNVGSGTERFEIKKIKAQTELCGTCVLWKLPSTNKDDKQLISVPVQLKRSYQVIMSEEDNQHYVLFYKSEKPSQIPIRNSLTQNTDKNGIYRVNHLLPEDRKLSSIKIEARKFRPKKRFRKGDESVEIVSIDEITKTCVVQHGKVMPSVGSFKRRIVSTKTEKKQYLLNDEGKVRFFSMKTIPEGETPNVHDF